MSGPRVVLALLAAGAAAPAAAQAVPDGLYLMTRLWVGSGMETGGFLFAQGQVARDPAGDPAAFDWDAARAASPASVGTLSLEGATLTARWADGSTTASELEPGDDGCFYWDGGLFCAAQGFATPALSGTYEGSVGASGAIATLSVATTTAFAPTGTYRRSGTASFEATSEGETVSGGSSGGEKGTYALSGTTLVMTPKGGVPEAFPAFPYGADAGTDHPEWIYFNGTMLQRR